MTEKSFVCQIQFKGKEFHEKKTFSDMQAALDFIERNRAKIHSVNHQPIRVFGMDLDLRDMSMTEIKLLLEGKDPFDK